jgi:hypothetical protein
MRRVMAKVWLWVKNYLWKFVGGLFMEDRAGTSVISLGRVLLLAVFVTMITFWHKERPELPGGLMEAFYALLGYVFGSKAVGTAREWLGNGKGIGLDGIPINQAPSGARESGAPETPPPGAKP